ncbi:MAG: thioredoxin fold domain-containing protein [Daejeonella sp.]|uniref:thioredoxin family protein n=1 Tax=Daejeonella sp. TaxID=2805397 RepID=UPI0027374662|nr:thioredoxin fold domain-containing protein [Daejeonella sp.]MDP3467998.1 thioredoxin fold domain-containing protein [Daejeonella sp.]
MKKALIIFLFLAAFELVKADLTSESSTGLKFRKNTFSEALQLAKKEKKLIFLYLNTSWCGPCIKLKMTTFRSKAVADQYNPSFINISLNAEKGDGPDLALKYQIRGYPSFLFINPDGKVIYRTDGFFNAKSFTELGEKVYKMNQRAVKMR